MIISTDEITRLIEDMESQAIMESIIGTASLAEEIISHRTPRGDLLPWSNTHGKFDMRPGELTLWGGDNGSGKSMIVGQVMAWLLADNRRVFIASMEMHPRETLSRMIRQAAGCEPGDAFVRGFCNWGEGRLWLYNQVDRVPRDRVLNMIRAVSQKLEVQHVVIDSLVKCGVKQDGEGALSDQTDFVDRLQHLAKHLGIHLHLVVHTRKPERAGARSTKYDIRGASQITDLADNVILVNRNRAKEAVLRLEPDEREPDDIEILEEPDAYLDVAKQRHFPWEGTFGLDRRQDSAQYVTSGHKRPVAWPDHTLREPWRSE